MFLDLSNVYMLLSPVKAFVSFGISDGLALGGLAWTDANQESWYVANERLCSLFVLWASDQG